ncbi:MAG: hypothetical protein JRC60_00230 [Deltaproteobacteria bacterium]|nr:hypothetical protein [Deltaproteobacteria bacterium]
MLTIADYLLISPDWGEPISYSRRWQTAIQNVITGAEKRAALFTWPRRSLSYILQAMSAAESNYVKRKLFKNLHNIWGIPFWQDRTTLSVQADAGQAILQVGSTENRNFEIGAPYIIQESEASYETGEISDLTATQITVKSNLNNTWAAGTDVYPVLQARLQPTQKLGMITAGIGDIRIEAKEAFDSGITRYIGDASDFDTYKGIPVFGIEPDLADGVVQGFSHPYKLLQFFGSEYLHSNTLETGFRISAKFFETGKAPIWDVLDFFDAMMGRHGHFWFPSWQSDIVVTGAIAATDTQLTIEDIDYDSYWANPYVGRYIYLLFPDGIGVCRRIMGHPSDTVITLEEAVGKACSADELDSLLVSFLHLSRFDADEIKTEYISEDLGEIKVRAKTIYSEAAETVATTTTTTTTSSSTSSSSSTASTTSSSSTTSTTA